MGSFRRTYNKMKYNKYDALEITLNPFVSPRGKKLGFLVLSFSGSRMRTNLILHLSKVIFCLYQFQFRFKVFKNWWNRRNFPLNNVILSHYFQTNVNGPLKNQGVQKNEYFIKQIKSSRKKAMILAISAKSVQWY